MRGKVLSAFCRLLCAIKALSGPAPHFLLYFIGLPQRQLTPLVSIRISWQLLEEESAVMEGREKMTGWAKISLSFIHLSANLISLAACSIPQETKPPVEAALQCALPPTRLLTPEKLLPLFQRPPGLTEHGGKHCWPQEKRKNMAHLTSHSPQLGLPTVRAGKL